MHLEVKRYSDNGESTLGLLFVNGKFQCYTLEDEFRTNKVFGETRIPDGTYEIGLRTVGGHHQRYSKAFPSIHKGMLHVLNVPNFKWILIHIGNDDDDTAGCLLVGDSANNNRKADGWISNSRLAYIDLYSKVIKAFDKKEQVTITYTSL